MKIKKIDHVVITTAHLDDCVAFYKALGFTAHDAKGRWELFAGDFKINVHIKGEELYPHAGTVQPGSADLCFELDGDLRKLKTYLQEQGFAIAEDLVARVGVRGSMQSFYLRDPDGNLIEISSYYSNLTND